MVTLSTRERCVAKLWHRCAPPPSPFAPKHDNVPVGDPLPSGVPKPADTTEARTSPDIPNHFFRQWSPHAPSACVLQRHFSQLSIWCTHDELHFFLPIHFDKNLSSSQLIPPSPTFSKFFLSTCWRYPYDSNAPESSDQNAFSKVQSRLILGTSAALPRALINLVTISVL